MDTGASPSALIKVEAIVGELGLKATPEPQLTHSTLYLISSLPPVSLGCCQARVREVESRRTRVRLRGAEGGEVQPAVVASSPDR